MKWLNAIFLIVVVVLIGAVGYAGFKSQNQPTDS